MHKTAKLERDSFLCSTALAVAKRADSPLAWSAAFYLARARTRVACLMSWIESSKQTLQLSMWLPQRSSPSRNQRERLPEYSGAQYRELPALACRCKRRLGTASYVAHKRCCSLTGNPWRWGQWKLLVGMKKEHSFRQQHKKATHVTHMLQLVRIDWRDEVIQLHWLASVMTK